MATQRRSERDIELDAAALRKAEAGEPLSADEARRVQAAEVRYRRLLEAMFAGFEEYAQAGVAERTASGGYSFRRDVLEAERQEHEHRRRRPSRVRSVLRLSDGFARPVLPRRPWPDLVRARRPPLGDHGHAALAGRAIVPRVAELTATENPPHRHR